LRADLAVEMIPYTAKELISIGEEEFKWIEEQMVSVSDEMSFGADWKAALEHTKNLAPPPGEIPWVLYDIADYSENFIEDLEIIDLPPLSRGTPSDTDARNLATVKCRRHPAAAYPCKFQLFRVTLCPHRCSPLGESTRSPKFSHSEDRCIPSFEKSGLEFRSFLFLSGCPAAGWLLFRHGFPGFVNLRRLFRQLDAQIFQRVLEMCEQQFLHSSRIRLEPGVENFLMLGFGANMAIVRLEVLSHITIRNDMQPPDNVGGDQLSARAHQREVKSAVQRSDASFVCRRGNGQTPQRHGRFLPILIVRGLAGECRGVRFDLEPQGEHFLGFPGAQGSNEKTAIRA
jgi:hypothetical protein